jgi:trehalose 6-phosphate synthase/phosphatase
VGTPARLSAWRRGAADPATARLLIVANRAPDTVRLEANRVHLEPSAGGLATGLRGPHGRAGGLWIGWPGLAEELAGSRQAAVEAELAARRVVPVWLSKEEVERYYEGFCNGLIWPLFHYCVGQLPLQMRDFGLYEAVNARFAETVAAHYRPGDVVWVHDYQLMLLPGLLRARLPEARIGFFLHIPFPSSELFRALPWRERLLEGLLGADLLGFHAAAYMRHFASSALHVLGVATDADRLRWRGREVRFGVFPMGVDAAGFTAMAEEPEVVRRAAELRGDGEVRLLVGIDRLDYTKGIPRRLLAFERLLRDHPELRERVRLIQVAVPSRTNIRAYRELREQVDRLIGRIQGQFATPGSVPIHYLFRSLAPREVVALYRAADAMLVTPIRDGMNLVAKEFVASRPDEDGVLVLSEFTGAAGELAEAVRVNPYDVDGTAEAYYRALTMPEEERRTRMRALRRRVLARDVHRWARTFLDTLGRCGATAEPAPAVDSVGELRALLPGLRAAPHLILLLDYDGTLVPFAPTPDLARPDPQLIALLRRLAARPGAEVHVVSGRRRETLAEWLGGLPLGLYAEHGVWSRPPGAAWTAAPLPPSDWRERVLPVLSDYAARTPGALLEEKTAGLAWHYRMADPEYGAVQANDLTLHLMALLSDAPVEVLPGKKVIEIRPQGVHKGRLVEPILAAAPPGSRAVALGDDRTDEDLFAALPPEAVAIHVGEGPSVARLRLAGPREARAFLGTLLDSG